MAHWARILQRGNSLELDRPHKIRPFELGSFGRRVAVAAMVGLHLESSAGQLEALGREPLLGGGLVN